MRTFSQIATEVSKLINDSYNLDPEYNFTRWSKEELIHYAEDAVLMLFTLLPKKFTNTVDIPLKVGSVQETPEGCSMITKVLGTKDEFGAISSVASNGDDRLAKLFRANCSKSVGSSEYVLESYSLESSSDSIFTVQPPVEPQQLPATIAVICVGAPADMDADYSPPDWMHNMIIEWMLYRAYSSEDESTGADAMVSLHLENFYAMIGNFAKAQQMLLPSRSIVARGTQDENA